MRKVFVSSTSEDLKPYRQAAKDVVLDLGLHPEMMEHFGTDGFLWRPYLRDPKAENPNRNLGRWPRLLLGGPSALSRPAAPQSIESLSSPQHFVDLRRHNDFDLLFLGKKHRQSERQRRAQ
jgi:hypothetical protein